MTCRNCETLSTIVNRLIIWTEYKGKRTIHLFFLKLGQSIIFILDILFRGFESINVCSVCGFIERAILEEIELASRNSCTISSIVNGDRLIFRTNLNRKRAIVDGVIQVSKSVVLVLDVLVRSCKEGDVSSLSRSITGVVLEDEVVVVGTLYTLRTVEDRSLVRTRSEWQSRAV